MGIRAYLTRVAPADVPAHWLGRDDIEVPRSFDERVRAGDGVALGKGFRDIAMALGAVPAEPWADRERTRRFFARLLDGQRILGEGVLLGQEEVAHLARVFGAIDIGGLTATHERGLATWGWSLMRTADIPAEAEDLAHVTREVIDYVKQAADEGGCLMLWVV